MEGNYNICIGIKFPQEKHYVQNLYKYLCTSKSRVSLIVLLYCIVMS